MSEARLNHNLPNMGKNQFFIMAVAMRQRHRDENGPFHQSSHSCFSSFSQWRSSRAAGIRSSSFTTWIVLMFLISLRVAASEKAEEAFFILLKAVVSGGPRRSADVRGSP